MKSNIFRLQNAQAIKLYPLFEKWLFNGGYVTDLERFKNDFGYNTSGYKRFNKIETYILQPAIEEINQKTNLLVNYQPTGDNLESKRPRIKGLIFTIKSKPKLLKTAEKNQVQSQNSSSQNDKNQLSTLYTIFRELKFEATTRLSREAAEATIRQWVEKNGYGAVYSGLIRAKDTYKEVIKNPAGFFGGNYFQNHKHYLEQKQESLLQQQREKEEKAQEEHRFRKLKLMIEDFRKRESDHFTKLFDKLSQEEKAEKIEALENKIKYLKNGELNKTGIFLIGEAIAISTGYDAQKTFQNLAKRDYNTNVLFDQDDKPYIQETEFDTKKFEAITLPKND